MWLCGRSVTAVQENRAVNPAVSPTATAGYESKYNAGTGAGTGAGAGYPGGESWGSPHPARYPDYHTAAAGLYCDQSLYPGVGREQAGLQEFQARMQSWQGGLDPAAAAQYAAAAQGGYDMYKGRGSIQLNIQRPHILNSLKAGSD